MGTIFKPHVQYRMSSDQMYIFKKIFYDKYKMLSVAKKKINGLDAPWDQRNFILLWFTMEE